MTLSRPPPFPNQANVVVGAPLHEYRGLELLFIPGAIRAVFVLDETARRLLPRVQLSRRNNCC